MNIIAVIPAHLASVRFPRKILHSIHGMPMIEHIRRRAMLSGIFSDVYVATCDDEIEDAILAFEGQVIRTANTHSNGTSRINEAIKDINCTHVVLLQGDEPLLLPEHLEVLVDEIKKFPEVEAWNLTGPIETEEELVRHSFVKCAITQDNRVLHCFRKTPYFSELEVQKKFVRKILGIIAYRKDFLQKLCEMKSGRIETYEFIEQMRIIENQHELRSVAVDLSLPSINEPEEVKVVLNHLENNEEQKFLLETILNQ